MLQIFQLPAVFILHLTHQVLMMNIIGLPQHKSKVIGKIGNTIILTYNGNQLKPILRLGTIPQFPVLMLI